MKTLRAFCARLSGFFHRQQRERELAAEIDSHLEFHIEDNLRGGMSPEEARRDALLKFGGLEATKEAWRERSSLRWLENLSQDLRYSIRTLRKTPALPLLRCSRLDLGLAPTQPSLRSSTPRC